MIWEFSVFLISVIYLALLAFANAYPENFFWPGLVSLLVLIAATKIISGKYIHAVFPAFLAVGSALFLPLIDFPAQTRAFMILSAGVMYLGILAGYRLGLYERDQTAKAMANLTAFSALFCWFAAGYGWYLNIEMPVWIIMIIFAAVTFPISFVLFRINQLVLTSHQKVVYATFFSYLMAGTVWIQDFWPFGYLTTGVIALIIYYSGWDAVRVYFLNRLTPKRVMFNILFLAGTISLILISTKWYPVI